MGLLAILGFGLLEMLAANSSAMLGLGYSGGGATEEGPC
jgi:hypothetical protein